MNNKLVYSGELTKISRICVQQIHTYLLDYDTDVIAYMYYNEKNSSRGRISLATKKEFALYRELGGRAENLLSLIVNVAHVISGNEILPKKLLWLVDHLLQHTTVIDKGESFRIKIVEPDIKDFIPVIRRWQNHAAPIAGTAEITLAQFTEQIKPIEIEQVAVNEYITQTEPLAKEVILKAFNIFGIGQQEEEQ